MRSMGNGITNCYPDQVDSFISITALSVGIDVPVEGRRQMAAIDVAADPPLGPQPFDGGVHVDGVPGDDGIRDQV